MGALVCVYGLTSACDTLFPQVKFLLKNFEILKYLD